MMEAIEAFVRLKGIAYLIKHNETTERQLVFQLPPQGSGIYREDIEIIPLITADRLQEIFEALSSSDDLCLTLEEALVRIKSLVSAVRKAYGDAL